IALVGFFEVRARLRSDANAVVDALRSAIHAARIVALLALLCSLLLTASHYGVHETHDAFSESAAAGGPGGGTVAGFPWSLLVSAYSPGFDDLDVDRYNAHVDRVTMALTACVALNLAIVGCFEVLALLRWAKRAETASTSERPSGSE